MGQGGSATAALPFIHHRKGGYQMVEKTDVSAAWPALSDPFRGFGTRLSDWLRPASDASSDDKAYRITLELPGVAEDDIHLTVANGTVSIRGEKRPDARRRARTGTSPNASSGRSSTASACRATPTTRGLQPTFGTVC
jgi:HSP20 family molecular chaperone IbpA